MATALEATPLPRTLEPAATQAEPTSLWHRELDVLGNGFTQGLGQAAQTTWTDLRQAGTRFTEDPLGTGVQFLKDHWHEAAVGAAITFINPRRWVNALLVAYSLRGLGMSTFEAAKAAADPRADLKQIKQNYAGAISHEGTAFLSSLPMTMLGGMAGRAAANAVFGKNLGALDLATGKVSLQQVKQNLWELHDMVRPPAVKLVVADMDNTLFPFSKHYAIGMKRAIADLSAKTGIAEDSLYQSLGRQMNLYHSQNFPWMLEVELADKLQVGKPGGMSYAQFRSQISDPFWLTMDKAMREHLQPFPSVRPTLETLKARGIPAVSLSNATAHTGIRRLTGMGIDQGLVERLYTLSPPQEPTGLAPELLQHGRERVAAMVGTEHGLKEFRMLPKEWEKPDTRGLQELMRVYNVRPKQVLVIGDSLNTDVAIAARTGARGLWLQDPTYTTAEFEAVIQRLIGRSRPPFAGPSATPPVTVPFEAKIASFGEVLNYIDPRPNYLGLARQTLSALSVTPQLKPALIGYGLQQGRQ